MPAPPCIAIEIFVIKKLLQIKIDVSTNIKCVKYNSMSKLQSSLNIESQNSTIIPAEKQSVLYILSIIFLY